MLPLRLDETTLRGLDETTLLSKLLSGALPRILNASWNYTQICMCAMQYATHNHMLKCVCVCVCENEGLRILVK